MLSLFRKNAQQEETGGPVNPEVAEHEAFAQWLERQPDDRKKIYLNLAMAYGFRMHGVSNNPEGEEPHD